MKAVSNKFCYTILEAVIKSEVEQEITGTLQKQIWWRLWRAKFFSADTYSAANPAIGRG